MQRGRQSIVLYVEREALCPCVTASLRLAGCVSLHVHAVLQSVNVG